MVLSKLAKVLTAAVLSVFFLTAESHPCGQPIATTSASIRSAVSRINFTRPSASTASTASRLTRNAASLRKLGRSAGTEIMIAITIGITTSTKPARLARADVREARILGVMFCRPCASGATVRAAGE